MKRWMVVVAMFLFVGTVAGAEPARLFVSPLGHDPWSGKLAEPNAAGSDGRISRNALASGSSS